MTKLFEITYWDLEENKEYIEIIEKVIYESFKTEKLIDLNLYVSIVLTIPEHIKELNKKYRNIDKQTDVLSFPMFEKDEIKNKIKERTFQNVDVLGDMVISIPRVKKQAIEYGHSFERELAYMVVHSFYHLMGYDHINEDDKKLMREKEEGILSKLSIKR